MGTSGRAGLRRLLGQLAAVLVATVPVLTPACAAGTSALEPAPVAARTRASPVANQPRAARAECATADLTVRFVNNGTTVGTGHGDLNLIDTSAAACHLAGWPGVSYVTRPGGRQVGPAAAWAKGGKALISLAPGQAAHAAITFAFDPLIGASALCPVSAPADWLRVFPPGQRAPAFVHLGFPSQACTNGFRTLFVGPIRRGAAHSQLPQI